MAEGFRTYELVGRNHRMPWCSEWHFYSFPKCQLGIYFVQLEKYGDNMTIKAYNKLPQDAVDIRTAVFVEEQGFNEEFDTIDDVSTHLVLYCDNKAAAVCRFYFDKVRNEYLIGRLAVLPEYRGKGFGADLVIEAENVIKSKGGKSISLHSQCQAQRFYEKLGFSAYGESDFDEDCPHQWMNKVLI